MILTILLSIILVSRYGIYGAVITSLIVYFLMWFRMFNLTKKIIEVNYPIKGDMVSYALVVTQWLVLLYFDGITYYSLSLIILAVIFIIQRKKLISLAIILRGKWNEILGYIRGG